MADQTTNAIRSTRFEVGRLFTPAAVLQDACVITGGDGTILYADSEAAAPVLDDAVRITVPELWLAPGFLDIHTHGAIGIGFGVGENLAADLERYAQWALQSGVTGFLCSVVAETSQALNDILAAYVPIFESGTSGARALGLHLEGPFLNPQKKGVFFPEWLREPSLVEANSYLDTAGKWIRQVSLAPELNGSLELACALRKAGITVALAHSAADYETARMALMGDFTHVTHTFNCMDDFNHRAPGVVGAILGSDEVTAELIGDVNLVNPGAMRVLLRCLGPERVVVVTDASTGAGLPDGYYELFGQPMIIRDGRSFLEDGRLAGSAALMNGCVRTMHNQVGASVQDAIRMVTANPARAIGLHGRYGMIAAGRPADLVLMDDQFQIRMTMVGGRILYQNL